MTGLRTVRRGSLPEGAVAAGDWGSFHHIPTISNQHRRERPACPSATIFAQSQTSPVGTGLRTVRQGVYKCEERADEGCPTSRLRANSMPRMLSIPHRTDLARLQQTVRYCKSSFHGGRGCVQGNRQGAPAHRASNASGTLTLANGKCGTKQKLRRFVGVLFCVGVYLSSRGRYQPSIVSASEPLLPVRNEQRLRPPPGADTGSRGWRCGRKNRGTAAAR